MKSGLLALVLIAAFAPGWAESKAFFSQIDLFQLGQDGVHSYLIPALVQTKKGTLIAVVDARKDSSQDLPNDIALVMRRSLDDGKTWQPMRTILSVPDGGVGDASLLLDRSNGRIWCFHAYGPPGVGFSTAKAGAKTGPETLQIHAMYSDDDGMTWSRDVDLTPQIKDSSWEAVFAASGTDIQLQSGRFLMPLVVRDSKGVIHSANAYSDDHGRRWKAGQFIGDGTDESHNVELRDATVLQNMRTHSEVRAVARSSDGGISFGPVTYDHALVDPNCNASITAYNSERGQLLIFTNAASSRREELTVKVSYDEGRSWPLERVIHAGPSAYSTVIRLKDGSIGVLYGRGVTNPYERITFARFTLGWVEDRAKGTH